VTARRPNAPDDIERPFNNLLSRLSASDFGLIAPHLAREVAKANDLLYNPGDDVEIVHFPCGPSLVSYIVPNENGRLTVAARSVRFICPEISLASRTETSTVSQQKLSWTPPLAL
jgi:hypothetical protein